MASCLDEGAVRAVRDLVLINIEGVDIDDTLWSRTLHKPDNAGAPRVFPTEPHDEPFLLCRRPHDEPPRRHQHHWCICGG